MFKKRLIYYFYIPYERNDHWVTLFNIHLNCLNTYNHIFDTYNFILSLDNINDTELIETVKFYIIKHLNLYNDNYEFIIVQNNPKYREGIHFIDIVLSKLSNYKDEIILWGHGKQDLNYDLDVILKWIAISHFQLSYDINNIEQIFINEKDVCTYGANLTYLLGCKWFSLHYCGSFYWLYPKKILELYKELVSHYCWLQGYAIAWNTDDLSNCLRNSAEQWISDVLSYLSIRSMNKMLVYPISEIFDANGNKTGDIITTSKIENGIGNFVYLNPNIWEENEIFSPEVFEEFYKYLDHVKENISNTELQTVW